MDRRRVLQLTAAGVALAATKGQAMSSPASSSPSPQPRDIVLVHGAWHGGWCWRPVARLLAAAGHRVSAPTLTGLGERVHLQSAAVDLDTHISDVVAHVTAEELDRVVLVGHSYGGFVVRGAAARLAAKVAQVIYLDAFVPDHGEIVATYAGAEQAREMRHSVARNGAATLPPLPAAAFGIPDPAQAAWVSRRMTPQPTKTYLQPLDLGAHHAHPPHPAYIACMAPKLDVFDGTRARIKAAPDWRYVELQEGHDVMVTAPELLARTVQELIVVA
ncbi:MAG: alpha/beta hydrolase [Pseudomonadota bacterium]